MRKIYAPGWLDNALAFLLLSVAATAARWLSFRLPG